MVTSTPNGAGDPTPAEKLLTREEAAERLRIHLRTVQRLIVSKELPAVRIGRHVRIDPADLATLEDRCAVILEKKQAMAFDWAWEKGKSTDEREFRIVQSSPTLFFPELMDSPFRKWAMTSRAMARGSSVTVTGQPDG